jgi:hypothetical protein
MNSISPATTLDLATATTGAKIAKELERDEKLKNRRIEEEQRSRSAPLQL